MGKIPNYNWRPNPKGKDRKTPYHRGNKKPISLPASPVSKALDPVIGSSNDYANALGQKQRWELMGISCYIDTKTLPSGQIIFEVIEGEEPLS